MWRIHGVDVASDLPLPGAVESGGSGGSGGQRPPTLAVVDRSGRPEPPPADRIDPPLLRPSHGDRPLVSAERGGAWRLEIADRLLAVVGDGTFDLWRAPGTDRDRAGPLVAGWGLAVALARSGLHLFHASALALGPGRAIAVVAPRGGGKSSVAALLAAAGALVLADDTVRVDLPGAPGTGTQTPVAHRGATVLRLRSDTVARRLLAGGAPLVAAGRSVDGRWLLGTATAPDTVPLVAVVAPVLDRAATSVRVLPVRGARAAMTLASHLRVPWDDPALRRAQFNHAVDVASCVRVFELVVPWRPGIGVSTARAMLAALHDGLDAASR